MHKKDANGVVNCVDPDQHFLKQNSSNYRTYEPRNLIGTHREHYLP